MTTVQDSEILTRVSRGTPMGELMRQYWIPAAKSDELEADGDPVRLMLLGEKLIAFRDTNGKVGVMDHRCPHRCASLFFGRNEEGGIRCVYHGWKFDVEGRCLDMANVPPHQDFKQKVRARAYRVEERAGLVWVYMGEREQAPPFPMLEPLHLPEDELRVIVAQRDCNYLQALEGDIDTSHFSFLHAGSVNLDDVDPAEMARFNLIDPTPEYEVSETEWGTMYGAHRPAVQGQTYWRVAHFLFPFWTMPPDGDFEDHVITRAWVPMDDTHTMFFHLSWTKNAQGLRTDKNGEALPGIQMGMKYEPNTTDWFGRWRLAANATNDYNIDRESQRAAIYSGITGIHLQDQAITESMGAITDHTFEHLAPSDHMITQTRKRLAQAAKRFAEEGLLPPDVDDPEIVLGARSGDFVSAEGVEWRRAYSEVMRNSNNPTGRLRAAE